MVRELLTHRSRECVLSIAESEIQAVRRADVTRTGLRIYDHGCIGVAGRLGAATVAELEPSARESLEARVAYPCEPGTDLAQTLVIRADLEDPDQLLAETEVLLATLRSDHPELLFSHQATMEHEELHLGNDRGLDLHHEEHVLRIMLLFKERGSHNIIDGLIGHVGRRYRREEDLANAREVLAAFHRPATLPPGERQRVVISAAASMSLPLDYFARHLDGRAFGKGASPLASRRGEVLFHEDFHLEQTRHPDDLAGAFFDAEGVCHDGHRFALIEAGRLVAPYTDRRTAAAFDLPLTGAATAAYDEVPSLCAPHLRARPGERSLAELLGGEPAVLVVITTGGDATSGGDFSAPVQLAFLHDGERFLGRLPELGIRANLHRMLGEGFVGVSSDCLPVSGSEHQLVAEMEVSVRG